MKQRAKLRVDLDSSENRIMMIVPGQTRFSVPEHLSRQPGREVAAFANTSAILDLSPMAKTTTTRVPAKNASALGCLGPCLSNLKSS